MYLSMASWSWRLVCVCIWREQDPSVCVLSGLITLLHLAAVLWRLSVLPLWVRFSLLTAVIKHQLMYLRWISQTGSRSLLCCTKLLSCTMQLDEIVESSYRPALRLLKNGWRAICVIQWPEKPQSCSCWPTLITDSNPHFSSSLN